MHELSRFIWQTRKHQIVYCTLALLVVLGWMLHAHLRRSGAGLDTAFWVWLEPLLGVGTLGAALSVWLGESRQDWENSLPKRLTVIFRYQGRDLFVCREAYLAAEGDIRPWAQQIGSQMSGVRQLLFEPFMEQTPPQRLRRGELTIMSYTVAFNLLELPVANRVGDTITNQEVLDNMHHQCLYWSWDEQQQTVRKGWR